MPHTLASARSPRITKMLTDAAARMGQPQPDEDMVDFVVGQARELEAAIRASLPELGYAVVEATKSHVAFGQNPGQISDDEWDLDDNLLLKKLVPTVAQFAAAEATRLVARYVRSRIGKGRCAPRFERCLFSSTVPDEEKNDRVIGHKPKS